MVKLELNVYDLQCGFVELAAIRAYVGLQS